MKPSWHAGHWPRSARFRSSLAEAQQTQAARSAEVKTALTESQSSLDKILTGKEKSQEQGHGLQDAYKDLASALRVVEGGDRVVPSQAIALYTESSQQLKARITEWTTFKQTRLPDLNRQLRQANLAPIVIADSKQEAESLPSR